MEVESFDALRVGLATSEDIRSWSNGEVKKPETINYRTLKPEKDGLFCEKIFGPTKDWECSCGKYKRNRFKGIVCERCGVEVTKSSVRRERMGHIELAAPVTHIWYFKGVPSRLGYLLAMAPKDLEKIIYFAAYRVMKVDENGKSMDALLIKEDYVARVRALWNARHEEMMAVAQAEFDALGEKGLTLEPSIKFWEAPLWVDAAFAKNVEQLIDAEEKNPEGFWGKKALANNANANEKASTTAADEDGEEAPVVRTAAEEKAIKQLISEFKKKTDKIVREYARIERPTNLQKEQLAWRLFLTLKPGDLIQNDVIFDHFDYCFSEYFETSIGAEAVQRVLAEFDLDAAAAELREQIATTKGSKQTQAIKRLKVVQSFISSSTPPTSMVLDVLPVLPPEIRPMVQLDGGRFATSDLNDLYRRVINRNNRLKRFIDLGAVPKTILNNEKRMLQEAVDALFDNGRRGRAVTGTGNRALKSLSDLLKGKQGRFRQNLLGKRVDYSGRSVIVVGPQLKLHQCGLPKLMALELFKPFVMKRLVDLGLAQNIKSAKRMVERSRPQVWGVLEEVIRERPVLLNRAPTLHRLGIQAFEPLLVEGKAIQLHPLVCSAFNADFDGDQMAVHLPLSVEAQAEARILMLASNNILKPSDGRPVAVPTQDMIIGLYHMTTAQSNGRGESTIYSSAHEALIAFDMGLLDLQSEIYIRIPDKKIIVEAVKTKVQNVRELTSEVDKILEKLASTDDTKISKELEKDLEIANENLRQAEQAEAESRLSWINSEFRELGIESRHTEFKAKPGEQDKKPILSQPRPHAVPRASRAYEVTEFIDGRFVKITKAAKVANDGTIEFGTEVKKSFIHVKRSSTGLIKTTLGRALFNQALPETSDYINFQVGKAEIGAIVTALVEGCSRTEVAQALDRIKDAGFYWATRSGVSMSISDANFDSGEFETQRAKMIIAAEAEHTKIQEAFDSGLKSDLERRDELGSLWFKRTNEIQELLQNSIPADNAISKMVNSGARGNWLQIRSIVGMRGPVATSSGDFAPMPVKGNYLLGLTANEYFINATGARKGNADTAMKTAAAGYLTRRLVDVAQDVIVREEDCGTTRGLEKDLLDADQVELSILARCLVEDVKVGKETLAVAGQVIDTKLVNAMKDAGLEVVNVRSVLTCESQTGVCAKCYGTSLATGDAVDLGEAIGIIAAQSIGEPGTQLTMRTFHTGGAASNAKKQTILKSIGGQKVRVERLISYDITQGLNGVTDLLEARVGWRQAGKVAVMAFWPGKVDIVEVPTASGASKYDVYVRPIGEAAEKEAEELANAYSFSRTTSKTFKKLSPYAPITSVTNKDDLLVEIGEEVKAGDYLVDGTPIPHEVLMVKGAREAAAEIIRGVQAIYGSQGVPLHDKHLEVIVRQMLGKVTVIESGDTEMLPGEIIDRNRFTAANREAVKAGKKPASARQEVMGMTRASLAAQSWLSAASFQETTRVLTQAALDRREDKLVGLKENVIIGKLIPAGTGLPQYRNISVEATEAAKNEKYPNRIWAEPIETPGALAADPFSAVELFSSTSLDDYLKDDLVTPQGDE